MRRISALPQTKHCSGYGRVCGSFAEVHHNTTSTNMRWIFLMTHTTAANHPITVLWPSRSMHIYAVPFLHSYHYLNTCQWMCTSCSLTSERGRPPAGLRRDEGQDLSTLAPNSLRVAGNGAVIDSLPPCPVGLNRLCPVADREPGRINTGSTQIFGPSQNSRCQHDNIVTSKYLY